MARLPARAQTLAEVRSLDEGFARLTALTGSLRNVLRIFKDQAARGALPQSHVLDRVLEPLAASAAQIRQMQALLTSVPMAAYARTASGDATLDLAADVPAFLAALDAAQADVKAALPALFDASGALAYRIVQDADGRPVSKETLTRAEADAIALILDGVLALIVE